MPKEGYSCHPWVLYSMILGSCQVWVRADRLFAAWLTYIYLVIVAFCLNNLPLERLSADCLNVTSFPYSRPMDIGLKDPTRYALISEEMISKCFEILSGFLEFFKPVVSRRYSCSQHSIGLKSNGLEVRLVAH